MMMQKRFLLITKWMLRSVILLLLILALLFGLVQTELGKSYLATSLSALLSSKQGIHVEIGKIDGFLPFDLVIEYLTVGDDDGEWLKIEHPVLRLDLPHALHGQVYLKELSASSISLERLPQDCPDKKGKEWEIPSWLLEPPPFIIEQFTIGRIELQEPVIGEKAIFVAEGRMDTADPHLDLAALLLIERKDGPRGRALLTWALSGKSLLVLNAEIEEAKNGLLSNVLGIKDAGSLELELFGNGPLNNWQGQIAAKAHELGAIEADIGLKVQNGVNLSLKGKVIPEPAAFPTAVASIIRDGEGRFSFDIDYLKKRILTIQRADINTNGASVCLSGKIDLKKRNIDVGFGFEATDLSVLETLAGFSIKGQVSGEGNLLGQLRRPEAKLSVIMQNVEISDFRASRLAGKFELDSSRQLIPSFDGLRLQGSGHIDGFEHKKERLPVRSFQWLLEAQMPTSREISLRTFKIENKKFSVLLKGNIDTDSLDYNGDIVAGVNDLGIFSALMETKMAGKAGLTVHVEGNGRSQSLSAQIKGATKGFSNLSPFVAAMVKPEVTYSGNVELANDRLMLEDLKVQTAAAQISAGADVDLIKKEVRGTGNLDIPNLDIFSQASGKTLQGSLGLDFKIEGLLQSLNLLANVTGNNVQIADVSFPTIAAMTSVADIPSQPRGRIQADISLADKEFKLTSNVAYDNSRIIITDFLAIAPDTDVAGNMSVDLQSMKTEGLLKGKCKNIHIFSPFIGEDTEGSLRVIARFIPGIEGQDIRLSIHGENVLSRFGRAKDLRLSSHLVNVYDKPEGESTLKIKEYTKDALTVNDFSSSATGSWDNIMFTGKASGSYGEEFKIETMGRINLSGKNELNISLEQFNGNIGQYNITLIQSAAFNKAMNDYEIKKLELRMGEGIFRASGNIGNKTSNITCDFQNIPLGVLHVMGRPYYTGKATGNLLITGDVIQPEATMAVSLKDVRLLGERFRELPPVTVSVEGRLTDKKFSASLAIDGFSDKPLESSFQVPVNFSLAPLELSLPQNGKLSGHLIAEVNLAHLPVLMELEDQKLDGFATIDLTLGGSIEAPHTTGHGNVMQAYYENISTGTILKEINGQVTVRNQRFSIDRAHAKDGNGGNISLSGWLEILPAEDFPYRFVVNFDNATLVRRDDVAGTISGEVVLSGSSLKTSAVGKVNVDSADIRIPEELSPEIAEIDVIEINSQPKAQTQTPEQSRPAHIINMDLKITSSGRVYVRGRGFESEWKGDLHVKGVTDTPAITGALSVVRGSMELFGKHFVLSTGTITFNGNAPPSPNFDVTAENKTSDITAILNISGTPSDIKVNLESDPSFPQDEVLSRVLFGRSVTSITPLQAVQLAQALNTLVRGGGGGFDIMGRTRKILGVERFDVGQSNETDGETCVTVGKHLMDGVYVEVNQPVGAEGGKVSVEVEITPNITVESEAGVDAQGGLNLNWKLDY